MEAGVGKAKPLSTDIHYMDRAVILDETPNSTYPLKDCRSNSLVQYLAPKEHVTPVFTKINNKIINPEIRIY